MAVTISRESPLQDDVRTLIAALNDHLLPLSPIEFQFKMTAEQMAGPDTTVFIARDETARAIGCGALKEHGGGLGEVKRMYTLPEVRGQRVGSAILDAIIAEARKRDIGHLVLETGVGEGFDGAWRLYRRKGFVPRGAFLDYPDSGHSAFFELFLEETEGRAAAVS